LASSRRCCKHCELIYNRRSTEYESEIDKMISYFSNRFPKQVSFIHAQKYFPIHTIVKVGSENVTGVDKYILHRNLEVVVGVSIDNSMIKDSGSMNIMTSEQLNTALINQLNKHAPNCSHGIVLEDGKQCLVIAVANEGEIAKYEMLFQQISEYNIGFDSSLTHDQAREIMEHAYALKYIDMSEVSQFWMPDIHANNHTLLVDNTAYTDAELTENWLLSDTVESCLITPDYSLLDMMRSYFPVYNVSTDAAGMMASAHLRMGKGEECQLLIMSTAHNLGCVGRGAIMSSAVDDVDVSFGLEEIELMDKSNIYWLADSHKTFDVGFKKSSTYGMNADPAQVYNRTRHPVMADISLFYYTNEAASNALALAATEVPFIQNFLPRPFISRHTLPTWASMCVNISSRTFANGQRIECDVSGFINFLIEKVDENVNVAVNEIVYIATVSFTVPHGHNLMEVTHGHSGTALYTADGTLHSFIKGGSVVLKDNNGHRVSQQVFLTPAAFALEQAKKSLDTADLTFVRL